MSYRIIFAGTPSFAVPVLRKLVTSSHQVMAVYTQPDRPAGRGRRVKPSAVKQFAATQHIPVFQPEHLKSIEQQQQLAVYNADLMVVVAYGLLLPKAVLKIPRLGCINVHASLLPRNRGAAPIQQAILNGELVTGVSIMQMDKGLDTGDVLSSKACPIAATDTAADLHDRLASLGADLLLETLKNYDYCFQNRMPQDNTKASYAAKIKKADAHIAWDLTATEIVNAIRAYYPYPVAFTQFNGQLLRIGKAISLHQKHMLDPGTLVVANQGGIDVACGEGVVRLLRCQLAGKKMQSAADFYNAYCQQLQPSKTQFG